MDVTDPGMVTDAREVHLKNAERPMDETPSGMVRAVREVQL